MQNGHSQSLASGRHIGFLLRFAKTVADGDSPLNKHL